jgi:omega-amidase
VSDRPDLFRLAVTVAPVGQAVAHSTAAIAEAAARGADLVLLPEEPDVYDDATLFGDAARVVPLAEHSVYNAYAAAARAANIGVIGCLQVKAGDACANTAFLLDRSGNLLGCYRKKHAAPGEQIVSTPLGADPFPVHTFEGVRIGLAICMDIHVPELFRIYGLKGADLVCIPTQYRDYTGDMLESIEKARAADSQMYLALSRYIEEPFLTGKDMGYAKVIAPDGRIICSTGHQPGVAVAAFDPSWRMPFWNDPSRNMRDIFDNVRQPQFYRDLTAE